MVLTVFAGVAEFERALIRHRTDEGREAAKRRGVSFGRPQKLRPDQKTLVLSLVQEGRSISEVARTFNVHPATIHRCLSATPKPPIRPYDSTPSRSDARSDSSFPPGRPNVPVNRLPLRLRAQPGGSLLVCRSPEVLKVSARGSPVAVRGALRAIFPHLTNRNPATQIQTLV